MSSSNASAMLLFGSLCVLLGCAESRAERTELPEVEEDAGARPAFDAAVIDSGAVHAMDASQTMSDASPPTTDPIVVGAADASHDATLDAELDAGPPLRGEVRLEVLTKPSPMSRYEPINILAIWVEDANGTPVKVIGRWAGVSRTSLKTFNARVPQAFTGFFGEPVDGGPGIGEQDPDAITAATQPSHKPHEVTWALTDYMGSLLPDGPYVVYIETNDGTGASGLAMIPFQKGPEPMSFEQGEVERFVYIRMTYTPLAP